jgi:hypothetical protein
MAWFFVNSNCGGCCKNCVSLSLVGFMVAGWLSAIGVLSWFCVESKAFELSVAQGASILHLVERNQRVFELSIWAKQFSIGC